MSSNPVSSARIAVVQFDPKFCAFTHAPGRVSPSQLWELKPMRFALTLQVKWTQILRRRKDCALGKLKGSSYIREGHHHKTVPNISIRIAPGSVDLVCLSEMVFTGGYSSLYQFDSTIPSLRSHPTTHLHRLRLPERRLHKTVPRRPDNGPNVQILRGTCNPPPMPRRGRFPRTPPGR